MSQTPTKEAKVFHTIGFNQRVNKNVFSSSAYRLTERKRSSSHLNNPETVLTSTFNNLDQTLNLPKINKRKRQKKKGNFLQQWLDEALGAPDPLAQEKQSDGKVEGSILKTLKRFEIDKRHLQSQNIPAQKIDKLYKGLYIYSHGVNKIFEQLVQLSRETGNNELIGNFWRAYTKLLESCTSYQTVFQKVEKQHLLNFQRLKNNIQVRNQSYQQQRKQLQTKIQKLQKTIQQKQFKYKSLKSDFDVVQNTLDLTDTAFNDEVNLRLKFEEKINAIYTSYEQLKNKYTKLVQELGLKNMDGLQRDHLQMQLKSKILVEKTKVDELGFLLKCERQKLKERDAQITIKNQELQDTRAILVAKQSQDNKKFDRVEESISKLKSLKIKQNELENIIDGQRITIGQQQDHIKKLSKSLEEYKKMNSTVYEKYSTTGKQIVELQSNIEIKNVKILDMEKEIKEKVIESQNFEKNFNQASTERDSLKYELMTANRILKDTQDTLAKNNIVLEDLKAVKDKYERINQYLREQLALLEKFLNKSKQELSLKTEELEGMKLLVENRNKNISQLQKQIKEEQQIAQIKITALNSTVSKKESFILELEKKGEQLNKNLDGANKLLKMTEAKYTMLQSEKIKVQFHLNSKTRILKELESALEKENFRFRQLSNKYEDQVKQRSDLSSKLVTTQFVLKTKSEQERIEVTSLTNLLHQYKSKVIEKAQHIHPMLYQESLEKGRILAIKEKELLEIVQSSRIQGQKIRNENKKLKQQSSQMGEKLESLQANFQRMKQQRTKLNDKYVKLQQKNKLLGSLYEKQQKNYQMANEQLERKRLHEKSINQRNKQLQQSIVELKNKLDQLEEKARRKKENQAKQQKKLKQKQKEKKKKQLLNQQVQTDHFSYGKQQTSFQMQKTNQFNKQLFDKQVQTQMQEPESPGGQTDILQSKFVSMQEQQQGIAKTLQQRKQAKEERQPIPQKKVESKQFKKALKLTYMRR